ncbi:enoyl-CoA hydratase/isomerase family protein [Xylogone sp. PMI_703]|nr:enoyl-CoA hydratase/isomerase family protein [Xylogone sp. PMI_703]
MIQNMFWNVLSAVRVDIWVAGLLFSLPALILEWWRNNQLSHDHSTHRLPTPWTKLESYPEFTVFQHGCSLKILLTNPRRGNSLTLSAISRLTLLFKRLSNDQAIYRILITGEGKYFCTGMDLQETIAGDTDQHFSALYNLFEAIDSCPQTTIAAINGPAFGGGVGLAFVFDIRISISDATMSMSEVKLGLCPATVSKFVVREWGIGLARMAMLTGKKIYSSELHRIGTIHTVVATSEELSAISDQLLYDLQFTEPRASALCKKLARDGWRDAGGEIQFQNIRETFLVMMDPNSQSRRGIANFRKGIRKTDWEKAPSQGFT